MGNIGDYQAAYDSFSWRQVEDFFGWHKESKVNAAYETLDKRAESGLADTTALIYKDDTREEKYSYRELVKYTNKFGNVLRNLGVQKGDRVFIFAPRAPEFYISFLGAIKIGAIVGPLFEAFMTQAIFDRLSDSEASVLITTSDLLKRVPLDDLPNLRTVILCNVDSPEFEKDGFYAFWPEIDVAASSLEIEWVDRETPMLMHYTSGSTGKPKGVLHAHNAILQHYQTGKWVVDFTPGDIYWCTADPGWITGTSYGIFAPWLNGVTNVIRGGRFNPEDWYMMLQRYKVNIWYSAPTAFRMLMGAGDLVAAKYDLSSLRHILSVGEPLNPEVIHWGRRVYGLSIHDNWWMTETGATLITNFPGMQIKPGSMGKPFPGIKAAILSDDGEQLPPNTIGNLAIKTPWPSMMRKIWKNDSKYAEYFRIPGWYISGDSAEQDQSGYFWFQGRTDDVINTAGEIVGPFEVESSLVAHPAVAEAGVIGKPDPVRGQIVKAFVALRSGYTPSDELKADIRAFVKNNLSAHSSPREIEFKDKLPKTRSGKIMRRVLRAWELGLDPGDLSTIED